MKLAVQVGVIPPPQPVWRGRKSIPFLGAFHNGKASFGRRLVLLIIVSLPLAHPPLSALGLQRRVL